MFLQREETWITSNGFRTFVFKKAKKSEYRSTSWYPRTCLATYLPYSTFSAIRVAGASGLHLSRPLEGYYWKLADDQRSSEDLSRYKHRGIFSERRMNVCASAGCNLGIPRVGNESRVARSRNGARFEEVKTSNLTRTDCARSFGEAICTFDEFLKFNSCSMTYRVIVLPCNIYVNIVRTSEFYWQICWAELCYFSELLKSRDLKSRKIWNFI